ncbi:MAG: NADPH-dependent F420 reductase [Actinomycetota bacterium]
MHIAVLGTGMVGRTIAGKLGSLSHEVSVGTRDVESLMARGEGPMGGRVPPFSEWIAATDGVTVATFAEAAAAGGLIVNATPGDVSLAVLRAAGAANLADKVLLDIANPLDFSQGMPPSLSVCNTDSLSEQIQAAFPETKVVKTLNTTNALVMVDPESVAEGDHTMFVAGNDESARAQAVEILRDWFGWKDVIDLGDLTAARGMEMVLPIWLRIFGSLGAPNFNFKIAR